MELATRTVYEDAEQQAEAVAAVRRGAELLDKHEPGWFERLDFEHFSIAHVDRCVIGQVFASASYSGFERHMRRIGVPDAAVCNSGREYGFYGDNCILQPLWRDEVETRKAAA